MENMRSIIQQLQLLPHPEGGYYKETYRSSDFIEKENLPEGFSGNRAFSTAIYYLLPAGDFSAFHAIRSDECWHFYEGVALSIYVIHPGGNLQVIRLGRNLEDGEVYQAVVPANCWFASRPSASTGYSLCGCTVSPGFDFRDFRMAGKTDLLLQFPEHYQLISELTR